MAQLQSTSISGTLSATGAVTLSNYGAGFVKLNASGAIVMDTNSYLTAESDTLASVTARGASTSTALSLNGGVTITGPNAWNAATPVLNIGGSGDGRIQVRHIYGKSSASTGVDHLWLQYQNTGNHVQIGDSGGGNNLYVSGSIYMGGYFSGNLVATQSWVQSQGYLTSGSFLALSGGTLTGNLTAPRVILTTTGNDYYLSLNGLTMTSISTGETIWRNLSSFRFTDVNDWDYNSWAGLKFINSTKQIVLGVAGNIFTANSAQTGTLLLDRISTVYVNNTSQTVWHSGNLTNLNQLTNGPGYITSSALSGYATRQDGARYTTDFNSILSSGFFNGESTPSNAPNAYGQLIVAKGIDTGLQIAGGYSSGQLWFRGWGYGPEANGFYAWRRLLNTGADPYPSDMNQYVKTTSSPTFSSNLYISADGSTGYVASRIWLYSHNNYRGAGIYLSGTGSTWFAGTGYTDFDGAYIISRRGVAADDSTAWSSYRLWQVSSSGNTYQTGNMSASTVTVYSGGDAISISGAEGRITFRDQALVWTGYVGFRGNLGVIEFPGRNVKINSGYNGTITLETGVSGYNSGLVSIPYGSLSVDNGSITAAGGTFNGGVNFTNNTLSGVGVLNHTNGRIILYGNLHIDSFNGNSIYLQYYNQGTTTTIYGPVTMNGYNITGVNNVNASRLYVGGTTHSYETGEGVVLMANTVNNHNYLVSNAAGWGSWNQWIRYISGYNTWRIGTYDDANNSGYSLWRLAGRNRSGNSELNYIVTGPRGAWGSDDRVVLWNPYARYDNGDWTGGGTLYKILDASNYSSYALSRGGDTMTNILYFKTNQGAYSGSLSSAKLQVYNDNNESAFMSFHRSGQYAVNFGLDQDNVLRIGGWSASANRWQLDMSGNNTIAGGFYTNGGLSTNGGNSLLGVQSPGGASRANGGSTETGAFKITFPAGIPVYGMFKLVIHIYEYGQRGNGYEIHCGGHMYPNYMYNRFQVQYGSSNSPLNVRYGNDGTYGCIWIGDTNTTWSYPQIWVSEFMMGYSNTSWTTWRSGWSISLVTSYGNSGAMDGPYTCDFGYAANATISSQVNINYNNDSNSTYQLLWGSGNSVYGTSDIYVNPYTDVINARGGYISNSNPWGTANSAYFPNGITTAGGDNWIYGHTYIGNAPSNGTGHEFWSNGVSYHRSNVGTNSHGASARWIELQSASGNFIPYSFESDRGNHSWGTVARFRINNSESDRPSIQFSWGGSDNRWNVGYCYSDDNFRITQNMAYRNDNSTSDGWGTERFRINTNGDTYAAIGGTLYANGSQVITTSNIGSQSVNYANYSNYLSTNYVGGQQTNPQVYFNNGIGVKVAMTGSWSVWSDTLWINGYTGGDVPNMCALHFLRNGQPRMAISTQSFSSTSYGSYYEVITAYNIASQSVSYASSAGSVAWSNVSSKPADWLNQTNLISDVEPSATAQVSGFYQRYQGAGNPTGTWFNYINVRHSNPANGHGFQIGMSYYDSNLWFRSYQGGTSPTFATWYRAIHNGGGTIDAGTLTINNGTGVVLTIAGGGDLQINSQVSGSNGIFYNDYGTMRCNISFASDGDITAYSDIRLKENIEVISNPLDKVSKLRGVTFTRNDKEDKEKRYSGVLAQEVLEVLPEVVSQEGDGYYSVAYGNMVGLLIESIKEQQKQIEELKSELKELKEKN